jgi:hypothetical protein
VQRAYIGSSVQLLFELGVVCAVVYVVCSGGTKEGVQKVGGEVGRTIRWKQDVLDRIRDNRF